MFKWHPAGRIKQKRKKNSFHEIQTINVESRGISRLFFHGRKLECDEIMTINEIPFAGFERKLIAF